MKLIIEFPESEWDYIKNDDDAGLHLLTRAIAQGTPLQAELEEIKAEIEAEIEKEFYLPDIVAEQNIRAGYLGALAIVDKHINQADCNNDCEHCEWTECPKD